MLAFFFRFSFFQVSVLVLSFLLSFFFLISGFYLSHNRLFLDSLYFYIAVFVPLISVISVLLKQF